MAIPAYPHFSTTRLIYTLAGLLVCGSAWAKLGGDAASVQADQQAWAASSTSAMLGSATLHTQTLPNGLTLRQYVDASGSVFAVAWSGPVLPDFERLLGSSYPRYSEALRMQRRGISLHDADLVIESSGMMRAFSGRAYLPHKLPATLVVQDIR
jgi:hypothetical protein